MLHSIARAFKLAIATYVGGAGAFGVMFWLYGIPLLGIAVVTFDRQALLLLLFPIGVLIAGLIWYLLIRVLYEVLLKALWSKPPQFLQTSQGALSVLWNYLIIVISMLPIALIYLAKFGFPLSEELSQRMVKYLPELAVQYFWLWLAVAIGCYQGRRFTRKPVVRP